MGEPMLVVWSLATYAGIGLVVGAAFVLVAAPRALGHAAAMTPGGRALLFPGAVALWPLVLWRWVLWRWVRGA